MPHVLACALFTARSVAIADPLIRVDACPQQARDRDRRDDADDATTISSSISVNPASFAGVLASDLPRGRLAFPNRFAVDQPPCPGRGMPASASIPPGPAPYSVYFRTFAATRSALFERRRAILEVDRATSVGAERAAAGRVPTAGVPVASSRDTPPPPPRRSSSRRRCRARRRHGHGVAALRVASRPEVLRDEALVPPVQGSQPRTSSVPA